MTSYQGTWESQVQGEGGQVIQEINQETVREHLCSITRELEGFWKLESRVR